jgi:hypothetical protein
MAHRTPRAAYVNHLRLDATQRYSVKRESRIETIGSRLSEAAEDSFSDMEGVVPCLGFEASRAFKGLSNWFQALLKINLPEEHKAYLFI